MHQSITRRVYALPSRQRGITLFSALILAAIGVFVLVIAMKILPSYSQHGKVVKAMRNVATEQNIAQTSAYNIREKLDYELVRYNVTTVDKRNFKLQRTRAGTSLSVDYEVPIPLFGHLSVIAKFKKTVPVGPKRSDKE